MKGMLTDNGEASRGRVLQSTWPPVLNLEAGGHAGDEEGQESVQELIFDFSSILPAEGLQRRDGAGKRGIVQALGEEWEDGEL
jgi:hypothetical protein